MSEKYLIFGATGSIGSSLAEQLVNSGNSVHLVGRNENETKSISEKLGCAFTIADVLEDGSRPNIDMSATYVLTEGWEVYGKTHWDIDASEMGDIKVGATLNF